VAPEFKTFQNQSAVTQRTDAGGSQRASNRSTGGAEMSWRVHRKKSGVSTDTRRRLKISAFFIEL
jgi:hypothetical protein